MSYAKTPQVTFEQGCIPDPCKIRNVIYIILLIMRNDYSSSIKYLTTPKYESKSKIAKQKRSSYAGILSIQADLQ